MPRYFYTAKSLTTGETKSGILEAKDEYQLARILRQEGSILIRAELEKPSTKKLSWRGFSFRGIPLSDKMFFTRNLRIMIAAGLPLPRAIGTLTLQAKNKRFRTALMHIQEEVIKGKSFSEALTNYPDIFSELFQSMIRAGEEAGTLEEILRVLSQHMERENELRAKIKGAMIYPAVIILTMIGIGILMLVTVVPKLAETFKDLGIELPMTTRIVIALADFFIKKWYLLIITLLFVIFLFWQISRTKTGKTIIDSLTLKIPIISPIIKNTNSAYTTRTLSSLISAGISLPHSLEITSGTLGNIYYKKALTEVSEKVRKGVRLSESFKPYTNIYPITVIQMISVGEETGETSGILAKLADFLEDEVSNTTKNLTSIIEPVLMLIIGAVVGFFAVSMIQPMYSMLGAIQ